jgi:hypothetical protein
METGSSTLFYAGILIIFTREKPLNNQTVLPGSGSSGIAAVLHLARDRDYQGLDSQKPHPGKPEKRNIAIHWSSICRKPAYLR